LTASPKHAILGLPVAEVRDPGGGENRCLFIAEGNVRPEDAAHNRRKLL